MWPSVLNVIEYIYNNHRSQYKWFLLSSERVYVNIYSLHEISDNAGPRDIVYTGHMSLEAGETPSHYCKSDAGVLLSQEGLVKLGSRLKDCAKTNGDPSWDSWLGKCINQTLGLSCFKIFSKVREKERGREGGREGGRGRERERGEGERERERGEREREEREGERERGKREGGREGEREGERERKEVCGCGCTLTRTYTCTYSGREN